MDVFHKLKQEISGGNDDPSQVHHDSEHVAQPTNSTVHTSGTGNDAEPDRDLISKLIAGSGHVGSSTHGLHEANQTPSQEHAHSFSKSSILDKITHKEEREKKAAELAAREVELRAQLDEVVREKKDNEGLLERIRGHLDHGHAAAAHAEESHHTSQMGGFLDKLTGKEDRERRAAELTARETELRGKLAEVEEEKAENEGTLEKLRARLDHEIVEAHQEGHVGKDEVTAFLGRVTGKTAEEERRRREEDERKANMNPFEKMKNKVNEEMGGGQKAEAKEDLLDKTIDMFQEHVLHDGPQNNESALEQMKDEQIAASIRKQLHLKDKKENE